MRLTMVFIFMANPAFASPTLAITKAQPIEVFKSFKGSWAIHSKKKELPIKMSYDIGSRGNIVTENFGKELSVISKDGQETILTHFCNRGHQSRLKLKKNSSQREFIFEAFDLVNLPSQSDAHVHRIIYKLKSASVVELDIVWKMGEKEKAERYKLLKME